MEYQTMTVGGLYGSAVDGYSDEEATANAEKMGYEVLDVVEHGGQLVLVVAD